jgi:hypothetical protein
VKQQGQQKACLQKLFAQRLKPQSRFPGYGQRLYVPNETTSCSTMMLHVRITTKNAWTWIQDHDKSANGMKAWLALVQHYDGTCELNKRWQMC